MNIPNRGHGLRLLDAGCGTGASTAALLAAAPEAEIAAYLMRNLDDPDAQLARFRSLLVPGGQLAIHEYSVRDSLLASARWNFVCGAVIIPLAWFRARDITLYRYLRRSVLSFDGVADFQRRCSTAGFEDVRTETMTGWQRGVEHTFLAKAPGGDGEY